MKVSLNNCLLVLLCLLFLFIVVNGSAHFLVREGMENQGEKEVVTAKKEKKAVKLPF